MKLNAYYIEDSESDFEAMSLALKRKRIQIFPANMSDWEREINLIQIFLQNQNERNRNAVEGIFKRYKIDLFIIDLKIFHTQMGGPLIREAIIQPNIDLNTKKIIYLTSLPFAQINVDSNTTYLVKQTVTATNVEKENIFSEKTAILIYDTVKTLFGFKDITSLLD